MTASPHGMLLVRGAPDAATAWARRGLSATRVERLGDWCGLVPAEASTRTEPPYDDPMVALVSRPLAADLRPGLGFFATGDRSVVTLRAGGLHPGARWLVRVVGAGLVQTPRLRRLRPGDLLAHATGDSAPVLAALRDEDASPLAWLAGLVGALGLPGAELLTAGAGPAAVHVEPEPGRASRFTIAIAGAVERRTGAGARA